MMNKRKNYRSIYGKDKIPDGWEIHHVDFNKNNNSKNNLMAVPKEVHVAVHQCGYCDREEINNLISIYIKTKAKNRKSCQSVNDKKRNRTK